MAGEGTPSRSAAAGAHAPSPGGAQTAPPVGQHGDVATHAATAGSTGSLRASDADRNAVVERLAKATGEGRITLEEFADAAGATYAAVTVAELDSLWRSFGLEPEPSSLTALPPPPVATTAVNGADPRATPAQPAVASMADSAGATGVQAPARTDHVVAIMSGSDRKGRWRVRGRTRAVALMGAVTLDLRDAAIESEVVEIEAWAVMGGVSVVVPEGIPVEVTGCVIMGGKTSRVADRPVLPGAPLVRVRARGMWGGVDVRSKPSRRAGDGVGEHLSGPVHDPLGHLAGSMHGRSNDATDRVRDRDRSRDRHRDHDRTRDRERSRRGSGTPDRERTSGDLLTVVCTDIVGSTRLAVSLGDQRWHSVITAHNATVRELLRRFGGTEVKTSGDGFLITFTSARAALQFSMAIQDAVAEQRTDDAPLQLRIGVHAGEVEHDGADVIGRNVTIACRLCGVAMPGEVLASSVVADLADSASDLEFGPAREHVLPGIDRPLLARPTSHP